MSRQKNSLIPRLGPQQISSPSVPSFNRLDFSSERSYIQTLNSVSNLGKGIFNAAIVMEDRANRNAKAAVDTYVNESYAQDVTDMNRLTLNNQDSSPEQFTEAIRSYKEGRLENMPDEFKETWGTNFDQRAASSYVNFNNNYQQKLSQSLKEKSINSLYVQEQDLLNANVSTDVELETRNSLVANFTDSLQSAVDNNFLSEVQKTEKLHSLETTLFTQDNLLVLQELSAEEAYNKLKSLSFPKSFTPKDQNQVKASLAASISDIESVKYKAEKTERFNQNLKKQQEIFELSNEVASGNSDYKSISDAVNSGLISGEKASSLLTSLAKFKATSESIDLQNQEIYEFVNNDKGFLDPKTSQKKIDNYFAALPVEQKEQSLYPLIQKTGVIPTEVVSGVRSRLNSGKFSNLEGDVDLFNRLTEDKPEVLAEAFSKNELVKLSQISDKYTSGMELEEIQNQLSQFSKITKETKNIYREDLANNTEEKGTDVKIDGKSIKNTLGSMFEEGFFDRNAKMTGETAAAIGEYKSLYEDYYIQSNGDHSTAKRLTEISIKKVYGTTNVNGVKNEFTKYPIEKYYNMPSDEIRAELIKDVLSHPMYGDYDPDQIRLLADTETEASLSERPTYLVYVTNEDGREEIVNLEGNNRWGPDIDTYNKNKDAEFDLKMDELTKKVKNKDFENQLDFIFNNTDK